ncbi:TraA family conjugative transfer protein [Ferrovum sp.]|uniref:TraA family conjugative transfer protein n=1 Tax=Ferrovum sp. TaxID=2609467 RepID=UPI00260CCB6C|nr:TraA family conjugative transfer protein [Ferrovum sp.]
MFANVSVMPALSDKAMKNVSRAALVGAVTMLAMATAYAGADTTFAAATAMITKWLGGSLGILISLATFATGIMITVTKHSLMPVAVAAAAALAIQVAPTVFTTMITATL